MPRATPDEKVAPVFDAVPDRARRRLLELRDLILETAAETEGVGEIEETLRWGEPSYITAKPKTGTTIRINALRDAPDFVALYVNCQTTLVDDWRRMFDGVLQFEGNRAVLVEIGRPLPVEALSRCISMALRYHLDK